MVEQEVCAQPSSIEIGFEAQELPRKSLGSVGVIE